MYVCIHAIHSIFPYSRWRERTPRTPTVTNPPNPSIRLTSRRLDLGRGALRTLLASDSTGLAPCGTSGRLRLLGLLLGLGGGLLLLALLDGSGAGGGAGLRAHGAALFDHVEGGADDGTLVLDGAAGALLGDFL